ncbi:hypothetical protein VU677_06580 [Hafnia paralvei]|uniref:hypothetical protein n=1 Tax=Hafnia paralvei TaxID=546367 RepID=UPI003CFBAFF3
MTKLTIETLKEIIGSYPEDSDEIECVMARQLLAYEQAAKNPVAWVATDSEGFPEYNSHNEFSSSCGAGTPLYAAPVLPKQPELPQGFTYESGILTANFGNGDVLISDTHWPESGHAGISFAPVPQPKRPNLSDYTDLLGGSKTEEIGTLFIVKSNSAESLIAIRNKLDIAINALSPAPAQPVIPEGLIKAINRLLDNDGSRGCFDALEQHRAKTELERLLAAAQQNEPQNIPENIPAQLVSQPYKFLGERAKYRVIIEGFSNSRSVDFEACSQEEAEEIGRDIFHEECNYGVERLESIPAQESE